MAGMSSRNRRILTAAAAVVAGCLCLGLVGVAGGAGYWYTQLRPQALPTLNPTQAAEKMDAIQAFVVATRGLQPQQPVERKFLSVDEVRQRTIDDFKKDNTPEQSADDVRVLAAFGLVQPGLDLYDLLIRLYSEGVAGFYDPDTQELVLVSERQGFNVYERTTFAHEYDHALQDQAFGIRAVGFSDEAWAEDHERFAAVQAVVEGDATLLEEQYRATLSPAEQRDYKAALDAVDASVYFALPQYLLYDFFFPYDQGLSFVRRYYDQGGWARVDQVWQHMPVSTEQILHPAAYDAGDAPALVARPALTDTLGSGWRLLDANVNGEWYTYLTLAHGQSPTARLPEETALQAAGGWGGDGYSVYYSDALSQTVLAAEWAWDTPADASEFSAAFQAYAKARFATDATLGPGGRLCWSGAALNCLFANGSRSLWLMAPDGATLEAVLGQYPGY